MPRLCCTGIDNAAKALVASGNQAGERAEYLKGKHGSSVPCTPKRQRDGNC